MELLELKDSTIPWDDLSSMKEITCVNHQKALYLSKNPWTRTLHFCEGDPSIGLWKECPCPFGDLKVIKDSWLKD